jgi:hypothetical protein
MADFTISLNDLIAAPAPKTSEAKLIGQQAVEGPLREAVAALPWAQAATGFAPLFGYPTGYDITPEQALTSSRQALGITGEEPTTMTGRAAGAALRTLTSPSTYYTSPLFGMPGVGSTMATAVPSAAGAQLGEEAFGLPGAIAGALAFGAPGQYLTSGSKLFSSLKQASQSGGTMNELAGAAGGKRAAGVAAKAFEADPELAANLLRATEIERLTGVQLPINAASRGSNVLLQEARSQSAQNPSFLAELNRQDTAAKQAIVSRALKIFGTPSAERILETTGQPATAQKSLTRRLADIDGELASIGNRVDNVDPTVLGTRITNLVKAKEEIARKEVSPLYEGALNDATSAGIKVAPEQTQSLYDFVNSSVNQDIFKTFPTIYSKVNSKFRPNLVLDDAGKPVINAETKMAETTFPEASVRDLDSLKREINKALRGDASADTRRVLNNLKFQLNTVVDELPDSFKIPYRAADAEYLRKVGIPFAAKGIEDIGSKGFVEQTVPVLTKNPSALNQFLDIAGPEGKNIVRDSFMYDLAKTPNLIDSNGAINVKVLDRFISKNQNTLKIVPDIADDLRGLSTDSKQLLATQNKYNALLKDEQKREANTLFMRVNNQGLDATIGQFFTSPNQQKTIMDELKKNPEALKGFRASVLENLTQSGNTFDFFNANKDAMNKLFGSTYIKNVEALAEASQALYANPVKLNVPISTIRKTKFQESLGMAPEEVVSLARRQITSPFQKVTIGLSKFFQNKANASEREAIQNFLLDPKKIEEVSKLYQKLNITDDVAEAKSIAGKIASVAAGNFARGGAYSTYMGIGTDFGSEEKVPVPQQAEPQFNFNFQ